MIAHDLGPILEREYGASSLMFAIQDGPAAGQTVPHVHIHIMPRKLSDFTTSDQVYREVSR